MPLIPQWDLKPRHRQLVALIKSYRRELVLASGCMLLAAACEGATAYLIKYAVDEVFIARNEWWLRFIPVAVLVAFFLKSASTYGQGYLMHRVGRGIIRELRNRMYDRIQDLPLSFFQAEQTGNLISRLTNDVNIVRAMVSNAVTASLKEVCSVIVLVVVIFQLDWEMALLAFGVLPFAFLPLVHFGRRIRKLSTRGQEATAEMTAFLHETIAGAKIVKAFGMERYEKERFYARSQRLYRFDMREAKIDELTSPLMEFIGGVGMAAAIFYGGYRVLNGNLTPGTFTGVLTAILSLYRPVKRISKLNNAVQRGLAATDRIFDILERPPESRKGHALKDLSFKPEVIAFEDVSFRYGDQNVEPVLDRVNFKARSGQVTAIVGMSGGGKTSLVNLIPRFYDVTAGCIRINDQDIREFSLSSLRRQIAIVTQEPILFNESIRDNIAYGNRSASQADIETAAEAAFVSVFADRLPQGLDTPIGELGSRLSGGERQRICIARALVKNAPILILDEATSALDSESETLVQRALDNLMQGRTTFVIAHRLSTIVHADQIIVMAGGRIVEEGPHEALMANAGEYYKLYQMQYGGHSEMLHCAHGV
ncbi:MAG: ABC transporter ATP-binding protein [Desulfobacterales bacterium]|nr:ABC transporter ATP-binding protein [Desulfobacterales bacterium]MDJ0882724.1 ABC transporter ATP-binding protein [Desulfobacterales bacterium]